MIDRERVQKIREKYGQKYPDFLMKYGKSYYPSESILGILYRNAVAYKKGDVDKLNNAFAHLNLNDQGLQASTAMPLNSLVRNPNYLSSISILSVF